MTDEPTLGAYLRARRALVSPTAVGLPQLARRRVPGLRREEVAALVGVSTDYYIRLEQGRADRPSESVLDAIGRALQLGTAERAYLGELSRPRRTRRRSPRPEPMRPELAAVVDHVVGAAAVVMNQRLDVLAWNPLAAALIADFPALAPAQRNMARVLFLDPAAGERHPDLDTAKRDSVGLLRMATGARPDDPALVRLVGELSVGSADFRRLWAGQNVHQKTHGRKVFRHPDAGELALGYETFQVSGSAEHMLVIYAAEAGSAAAHALAGLAELRPAGAGVNQLVGSSRVATSASASARSSAAPRA